jgi:hypothetical protein
MFLYPTPELPDDTPIDHVRFSLRVPEKLGTKHGSSPRSTPLIASTITWLKSLPNR